MLAANIKRANNNCFNGYDLGLYHEALVDISSSGSLNPYVTIRGLKIFTDHFDPILIVGAQFVRLGNYHIEASLILEWVIWLSALGLLIFLRRPQSYGELILLGIVFFCAKGIANPVNYPVHAALWSLLVWITIGYGIVKENAWIVALACLSLVLFRESYPVAVTWFSLYYLFGRDKKLGLSLLLIGLSTSFFVFYLRPILLGDIHGYGKNLLTDLFSNPLGFLWETALHFHWLQLFDIFAPLVLLGFYSFKFGVAKKEHWQAGVFLLLPLFGLQFLARSFGFQYSVQFAGVIIAIAYFQGGLWAISQNTKARNILVIVCLITMGDILGNILGTTFLNKNRNCTLSAEKSVSNDMLEQQVLKIQPGEKLASTGGAIPRLIRPGLLIYQIGGHSEVQESYDYLLLERNQSGDTYPLSDETIKAIEQKCSSYFEEVLHSDEFFVLAKGTFPKECVHWGIKAPPATL